MALDERIELVPEQKPREGGVTVAIVVSTIVHCLLAIYVVRNYHPLSDSVVPAPIVHYVELMRQNPRDFTEAPGPKANSAPITAPYSDANRKASMPKPTGDQPTKRPGDGSTIYTPPAGHQSAAPSPAEAATRQQQAAAQQQPQQQPQQQSQQAPGSAALAYRQSLQAAAAAPGNVDLKSAIREIGKVASLGGRQGLDLSGVAGGGGEKGFAENGPVSFETQWYDWGEYAQSMVSKIRVNWLSVMPELIKTGMKGVVTIRFTIHRDGTISDITILNASTIPPYDFAAKKALELSSPLNPLPKDFPKETEHVTAMFFYNEEPPSR